MKRNYTVTRLTWNDIEVEVRWNRNYLVYDDQAHIAHLEIVSVKPKGAPLPITETGYRSHFTHVSAFEGFCSPEEFVEIWLDHASLHPAWREAQAVKAQLSLF